MRKSGPTSGTPSAMRAWILIPSPERRPRRSRPEADELVAGAELARGRPADDLAPEPVVDRVARAIPPAPGAVGADPEHLAQSVGHRGDHGRVVIPARRRRAPWRPAWPGRRGTRGGGEGPTRPSGWPRRRRRAGASARPRLPRETKAPARSTAPGGRLGCAGSSDGSGSRRRRSVTGEQGPGRVRLARLGGPAPGPGDDHQRPPARRRTTRAAPRSRRGQVGVADDDRVEADRAGRPRSGRPGGAGRVEG